MRSRDVLSRLMRAGSALVVLAHAAQAQQADTASMRGTVTVIVHDSLAGQRLTGASVQLVSAADPTGFNRMGDTDPLGRFTFRDIPRGRYTIGFLHPVLDTLGVEAPARQVEVDGTQPVRVELAVPSPARIRAAICGPQAAADSSAVILGTVRDPRDRMPLTGATVAGGWMEVTFSAGAISQRPAGIAATTGPNGWFALCGLPAGTVMVTARRGSDSTHALEMQFKPGELRRRDFYVAAEGRGRLAGRVVAADSARPLGGARVSLVGGAQTVADAQGAWALADVPLGTRMLEIRALGYYPERRAVDVVADGPPVDVALSTFQAVLDAVHVTADRTVAADLGAFERRQRGGGMGRFMTSDQIARRNPIYTSDLFRTLPGFTGDGSLAMRSNFSNGAGSFGVDCVPEVYIDGHLMRGITAADVDGLVWPENIAGIEVYSSGSPKPPQFDSGLSGCGSLVIWQKVPSERVRRRR